MSLFNNFGDISLLNACLKSKQLEKIVIVLLNHRIFCSRVNISSNYPKLTQKTVIIDFKIVLASLEQLRVVINLEEKIFHKMLLKKLKSNFLKALCFYKICKDLCKWTQQPHFKNRQLCETGVSQCTKLPTAVHNESRRDISRRL